MDGNQAGKEEGVLQIIDEYFEAQDKNFKPPETGKFWPSMLWGCMRNQWYGRKGVKEDISAPPHGLFESGRRTEAALYDFLKWKYGDLYVLPAMHIKIDSSMEPRLPPDVVISGKTDPVLLGENGKVRRVYESKSSSKVFDADGPKPNHLRQLMAYIFAIRPEEGGRIWFCQRDDYKKAKEFKIEFDENLWSKIVEYVNEFHYYVKEDVLPPPNPMGPWECKYCPASKKCLADGPAEEVKALWKKQRKAVEAEA